MLQLPFFVGMYRLEITCADTIRFINALTNAQVRIRDVVYKNDLVVTLTVPVIEMKKLVEIAEKQGARVVCHGRKGLLNSLAFFVRRPVLSIFFLGLFLTTCFLPGRILFVTVEGNTSIPTKQILEAVDQCGIHFGTNRRSIRSEVVKNALLQEIPELQWAGINTVGCTAIIAVQEKTVVEKPESTDKRISSIIATRDGIIQDCTVLKGSSLCTVGQAVKAGQTLVSGYTDTGLLIQGTQAEAEITALTTRELELIAPSADCFRAELTRVSHRYSIKFGKKLINFYKDSGNPPTECVKIYSERYLTLPGGFRFPVCVIVETSYYYEIKKESATSSFSKEWLEQYAEDYLRGQMVAGQILSQVTKAEPIDNAHYLYGKYACLEMIGKQKYEDTLPKDDYNDRTNRKF